MSATPEQLASLLSTVYDPLFSTPTTATGASLAATVNARSGVVTTEQLTKGSGDTATYTITNNKVRSNSVVMVSSARGSLTTGSPVLISTIPSDGSFSTIIQNVHATDAMNGTIKISFLVLGNE